MFRYILRKNKRAFVFFLLGSLVGGATFLFFYGKKIDSLLHERNAIYYANNKKNLEIVKLQKELENYGKQRSQSPEEEEKVQKIIVEVTNQDIIGIESIRENLEKMMEPFSNKPIKWLYNNPEIIALAIEKKQIFIDKDRVAQVQLKYVSFYQEAMKIWVQVNLEDT